VTSGSRAETAVVSGDLRTLSQPQLEQTKQTMEAIVKASLPHTEATITFDEGYPPMAPTEGNATLLALYDKASRDLGFGAVTAVSPDRAGAADVSFVAGEVKMILDGVGLMGHDDHTVKETADLTTLPSQTKRMAVLLYRLVTTAVLSCLSDETPPMAECAWRPLPARQPVPGLRPRRCSEGYILRLLLRERMYDSGA
jgi:metal-dependent amidase/aminoacylase/carboxypeptidase family protein